MKFLLVSLHWHGIPCHTRKEEILWGKEGGQNNRLDHGLHVLKPRSFPLNHAPKKQERHQLFFGLWLVSKEFKHSAIQTKIEQHSGGLFHQIKVRQPIGRQDSLQTWIQTSRRLDSFLHEAARNFEVFQIFNRRLKNQKPITVDVLFKAYPMVPLSSRSNLAGRYLFFKRQQKSVGLFQYIPFTRTNI